MRVISGAVVFLRRWMDRLRQRRGKHAIEIVDQPTNDDAKWVEGLIQKHGWDELRDDKDK